MALPDSKAILRLWLRATPSIFALVNTRIYFAMPEQDRPLAPFILFYRVGGTVDEHRQDYPDFIIECWGDTQKDADDLGLIVAEEILILDNGRHPVIGGVRIVGARINSMVPVDGTTWAKRTRLDTSFQMRLV